MEGFELIKELYEIECRKREILALLQDIKKKSLEANAEFKVGETVNYHTPFSLIPTKGIVSKIILNPSIEEPALKRYIESPSLYDKAMVDFVYSVNKIKKDGGMSYVRLGRTSKTSASRDYDDYITKSK